MNTNLLAAGGTGLEGTLNNPIFGNLNLKLSPGSDTAYISSLISRGVGLLFVVGGVAFFFIFLLGGISWILSGGDKGHVESAKAKVTNALIGFVLMIGAFALVKLIEVFFGIDILSIDIGPLIIQ